MVTSCASEKNTDHYRANRESKKEIRETHGFLHSRCIGKRSRGEVEKKTEFNFTMRGKKEQVATGLLAIQKHLLALKITLP